MPTDLLTGKEYDDQGRPINPDDFSVDRMIGNIPSSALQVAKDTIYPFMNPVETVQGLNSIGSGLGQMAAQATIPNVTRETMPNPENVDAVHAVGDHYSDRYGSIDNALETLQEDPAGMAADLAGALSGPSYLASKVAKGSKLAGGLKKTTAALDATTAPTVLAKAAPSESLYRAMLNKNINPKTGMSQAKAKNIGKQAYDLDITPDDAGARRLDLARELRGKDIDAAVDAIGDVDIPVDEIYMRGVPESMARQRGTGLGSKSDAYIKQFDNTVDEYMGRVSSSGDTMTPRQMQAAKVGRYKEASPAAYGENPKIPAVQEANKMMGYGAKSALEDLNPDMAGLNQRFADVNRISEAVPWNANTAPGVDHTARIAAASSGVGRAPSTMIGAVSDFARKNSMRVALLIKRLADNPTDNALARAIARQTGISVQEVKESKPVNLLENYLGSK